MAIPTYPLTFPSEIKIQSQEFSLITSVAKTVVPFNFKQFVHNYGGSVWKATYTIPPVAKTEAGILQAFFMQLHGSEGTFLLGDQNVTTPKSGITTQYAVNGAHLTGSFDVNIDGCANDTVILKAGDYVQFNSGATTKLHMVVSDVTSNGSGEATLPIEPSLKSDLSNDAIVVTNAPKCVFRMDSNELGWSSSSNSVYAFSFACTEAL